MKENTIIPEHQKTSFFNSIGMIDVERFHSSMIRWILSEYCGAFSKATRGDILSQIFKSDRTGLNIEHSQNEWNNIDVIFKTKSDVWVIENKIKCDLHDNQLAKYSEIILNKKYEYSVVDKESAHFAYLTLLPMKDEVGICENREKVIWHNITHGDIANTLKNATFDGQNELDKNIVSSYAEALSELVEKAKRALMSPEMLFELRNCEEHQDLASYIDRYNLRNILQRYYFYSIVKDVYDGVQEKVGFDENNTTIRVSPAANGGTAVLVLALHGRLTSLPDAIFGIQLQDGSYKIDISIDYDNVKKVIENRNRLAENGWMGDNNHFSEFKSLGWRLNYPKSRARIAISRKEKEMDWSKAAITNKFIECYEICQQLYEIANKSN